MDPSSKTVSRSLLCAVAFLRKLVPLSMLTLTLVAIYPNGLAAQDLQEDGASQIFWGRGGSYEVTINILPAEPAIGIVHFSVGLLNASTSLPVNDAEVSIIAKDDRGQSRFRTRALNTPGSPKAYEANITFDSAGVWTLLVEVRTNDMGQAVVTSPIHVREQSLEPNAAGGLVLAGVVIVLGLIVQSMAD